MEGVTGMMARLRHVPGCSRGGLYGPANIDFRFLGQLRLQRAGPSLLRFAWVCRLASGPVPAVTGGSLVLTGAKWKP